MRKLKNRLAIGAIATAAIVGLTACGGGASGGDASGDGEASGDESITVGISISAGQNATLQAIVDGLEAELEREGAELLTADAQLNIDKQIADIDTFVNQGVDAIVVIPLDFVTLGNALDRADMAGIPLFANDAVVGTEVTAEEISPFVAQVATGRAQASAEAADFIEERTGGEGQVAAIGIAAPVEQLDYALSQFIEQVEERPGLEFVGDRGNPSDDAAGARPLAESFLTQHPDLRAIYTYNDPSAVGAAAAVEAADRRDEVTITGYNASQDGLDALESGSIDATWDYMAPEQGQLLGRLIIASVLNGQDIGHQYVVESHMLTSDNIGEFVSWEDRIEQIRSGELEGISID